MTLAETTVRPALPGDLPEVAEVLLAARRDAMPAMPPVHGEDAVRAQVAALLDRGREVWVAEEDQVTGFAALHEDWLESLYVGPRHQGRGIGTMLLEVVKAARPDGFGLWVFAGNAAARGFYHRHGLVELEHTDGSANEEGEPDVRMVWPGHDPIGYLRRQIDLVDDELALLLARRAALTGAVQGFKDTPGQVGRDLDREREIAERMARHAPGLGPEPVARIMHVVIGESLDAWERAT